MAAARTPHVGDIGVLITLQVVDPNGQIIDLSAATGIHMDFLLPDQSLLRKTAVLVDEGTGAGKTGKVRYTTIAGFLSLAGEWYAQPYVESMGKWHADAFKFKVKPNLDTTEIVI